MHILDRNIMILKDNLLENSKQQTIWTMLLSQIALELKLLSLMTLSKMQYTIEIEHLNLFV